MDKELKHHDHPVYENLIKCYMALYLEKLDKEPDQKCLNPMLMNETKSAAKKMLNLVPKNLAENIYFLF